MTTPRNPETILASWLEEGPTRLPEVTRRAIAVTTRTTRQARHPMRMPWRTPWMNPLARMAIFAIAVVVAIGGAVYLFSPGGGVGGPPATAAPSVTPLASAQPSPSQSSAADLLDPSTWATYVSNRYGFSIGHPASWTARPSDHVWTFPADVDWLNLATEGFIAPGNTILATAWSVAVEPGTTLDSWLQTYCPKSTTPCTGIQDISVPVSMDGHAGSLVQFADDTQAFVLVANRVYVVAVWEPDRDPRTAPYGGAKRLLEAYLASMHLLQGGPASPVPSATARPS